jgi:hypothetical protein
VHEGAEPTPRRDGVGQVTHRHDVGDVARDAQGAVDGRGLEVDGDDLVVGTVPERVDARPAHASCGSGDHDHAHDAIMVGRHRPVPRPQVVGRDRPRSRAGPYDPPS